MADSPRFADEAEIGAVDVTLTRRTGGGGGTEPRKAEAEEIANAPLERQKFRLLQASSRDRKTAAELDERLAVAQRLLMERKLRLSDSNALFMTMPDAAARAPRQRLGAANAVLGTKRIIERELSKVHKEAAVMAMKVNKAKAKNGGIRGQIDATRKDALTFRKLFAALTEELGALQGRIRDVKADVEDGYDDRDRALEDMRNLTKQFEVDKLERQQVGGWRRGSGGDVRQLCSGWSGL